MKKPGLPESPGDMLPLEPESLPGLNNNPEDTAPAESQEAGGGTRMKQRSKSGKKRVMIILLSVVLCAARLAAAILPVSASLAEKPLPSREYFENLDKGSRLEDIVEDIGQGGVKGSGIIFHTWHLEDGSEASVIFDSKGRINMIYIQNENRSERIYKRMYILTEEGVIAPDALDADLKEAIIKMNQAMNEHLPPSARMSFAGPAQTDIALYDLTGDGSPDLFTNDTWGSGMVRTDLIAYDPVEEKLYVLDGYNYDYLIDKVEKDRIVIVEEGPHGYGDPVTKTYGTVKLENGKLVFIPDSEEP